jgi:hypothetical protein
MLAIKLLLGPSSLTARIRVNALARADSSKWYVEAEPAEIEQHLVSDIFAHNSPPVLMRIISGVWSSLSSITFIFTHFAPIVERDDFDQATADRAARYYNAPSTGGHRNVSAGRC